jgi:inner membrane protein
VDSLTHGLIITVVFVLAGRPDLAAYGIIGAVLIDVDVLFGLFSGRDPRLYIFTHGGFTHSFIGAFIVTLFAAAIAFLLSGIGPFLGFGIVSFLAILVGAMTHITADYLAYPGIPLFYPLSDKKYTLGILGGPSVFIMLASVAYIAAMILGLASIGQPWPYMAFFAVVIAFCAGAKAYAAVKASGRTVATLSPFKWMVIEDLPDSYRFYVYDFFRGTSAPESYEKYRGLTRDEAEKHNGRPEVKRLRYNSYIVVAEKDGGSITYSDPVREKGHIWYPPNYKSLSVSAE